MALTRRIALLLILFATVITLLVSLAMLIYQTLLIAGTTLSGQTISRLSWALGASIVAGGLLVYHLRLLLADQRQRATEPLAGPASPAPDETTTVVIIRGEAAIVASEVAQLRQRLAGQAQITVLAGENVPPDALQQWQTNRAAALGPAS